MKHKFKRLLSAVSAVIITSSALPITELTLFAEDYIQEEVINEIYESSSYDLTIYDAPLIMASETNSLAYTNAETFAADCILQGLTDINTGKSLSDFVLYSQVLNRSYGYEDIALELAKNKGLVASSKFWTLTSSILDSGPIALKDLTETQLYEVFLIDYLEYQAQSSKYGSDYQNKSLKFANKLMNYMVDYEIAYFEDGMQNGKFTVEEAMTAFTEADFSKEVLKKYTKLVSEITTTCTTLQEFGKAMSKLLALAEVDQQRVDFLLNIKKEAYDNKALCNAIDAIVDKINSPCEAITLQTIDSAATLVMKNAWLSLTSGIAPLKAVGTAKSALDMIFNTNDTATNNIKLLMMYTVEQYAQKAVIKSCNAYDFSTEESAAAFNANFTAYLNYQEFVSDWTNNWTTDALLKGWFNNIKNLFSDKNENLYHDWENRLNYDASFCQRACELMEKFKNLYYTNVNAKNVFDGATAPVSASKDNVEENQAELEIIPTVYTINKDITLNKDMTINGDVFITANVDLNEYSLTINGDLIQNGGQMKINSGTLNVNGNYTIQNKTHVDTKTKEIVQDSNGTLFMEYADGSVNVHGDFYMKSNILCGNFSDWNYFKRGTLAIDGNFYQYNNISSNSKENFQANGTTVKFVGSGTHEIYFESGSSYIGDNMEAPDDAKIKFTGVFHGFKLAQDIVIDGDATYDCADMDLNGYTLTINGNFIQNGGQMKIYGGTLNVNGDYTIQNKTHVDTKTKEIVQDSNGTLFMEYADGSVNVHGDFYMKSNILCGNFSDWNYFKRGTLAIDGNFYQYNNISGNSKENFQANGTTVKFVGSGTHEIYFESGSSYIGDNMEAPDDAKIKFTGVFHGFKLAQDIVIDGDATYDCADMDLNGYTLTINGNFIQNGGQMKIYGGTLNVNGDYTIQNKTHVDTKTKETIEDSNGTLYMEYADGSVNVHGDFYMKSNILCGNFSDWNYFKRGTLAIDGNFYQYNNISGNSKENFQADGTTVKFVGEGTHKITSESSATKMSNIALTDGAELSFNGNFGGFDSISSCTFSSEDTAVAKTSGNSVKAVSDGNTKLKIENTSGSNTTVNLEVQGLVAGDSNFDGEINIADAVILQKYLLGSYSFSKAQWEQADLNQDGYVDVFDMCLMRRKLINK